jgi:hypothetical protein
MISGQIAGEAAACFFDPCARISGKQMQARQARAARLRITQAGGRPPPPFLDDLSGQGKRQGGMISGVLFGCILIHGKKG